MTYAIKAPARYAQGAGELANLGRSAKKLGNKFLVICTDNSRGRFGAQVEASLAEQEKEVVFTTFHGEATKDEVFAKMDECRAQGCDVVVGMGGGKALDTAKAVAENLGLPCVIIPTVASNDAPCSGVAVLYNDAGVVIKAVLMRRNPDLVLVDTGIIANAPRRLFAAGLGDALSTWFEARACKNSGARTMARGNVSNTGLMMARLCYDLLMEKGRDALAAVERHEVTPALEDVVEATIYLSGLGFENGGLAAAHAVNDGFAQEPQAHGMYHGEKVAFGTLVQLVLEKAPQEELEQVLGFLRDTGLPLTLAQLGVKEIVPETLKKVAEAAVVPTQSTKNLRADITAQEGYDAIFGNRTSRGDGFSRAVVEKVLCAVLWTYFHVSVPDANAPFRLMKADYVAEYLPLMPENYNLPNALMTAFGAYFHRKIRFIPISFKPRQGGTNSINIRKIVKIGRQALHDFCEIQKAAAKKRG